MCGGGDAVSQLQLPGNCCSLSPAQQPLLASGNGKMAGDNAACAFEVGARVQPVASVLWPFGVCVCVCGRGGVTAENL